MLSGLRLNNFRNFEAAEFDLSAAVSVFTGRNGSGKSSILEAVYFGSTLRSFRTLSLGQLKKIGTNGFSVEIDLVRPEGWKSKLKITDFSVRSLYLDGKQLRKASEFAGIFKTVAFLPDDSNLVTEGPMWRRRFLDRFLCMTDPEYYASLQNYLTSLKNYNRLLKNDDTDSRSYAAYASVLAEESVKILPKRAEAVRLFSERSASILAEMRPELSDFSMVYKTDPDLGSTDGFLRALDSGFESDRRNGFTHTGPHYDELELSVNGKSLRNYGSRGQCRLAALSMKMAEFELLSEKSGKDTVVILDDAFSDLDEAAKRAFLKRLRKAEQLICAFPELPVEQEFEQAKRYRLGE